MEASAQGAELIITENQMQQKRERTLWKKQAVVKGSYSDITTVR